MFLKLSMDKNKKTVSVYNEIADIYAKTFTNISEPIDEFLKFIPQNGKILDIGCGTGIDAKYMQEKGFIVTGVDPSQKMLDIAKKQAPLIKFKLGDCRKLDFAPNYFNGIFSSFSLIHIQKKDVREILKDFYRILKKEGILYIGFQEGDPKETFINAPIKPDKKIFLNVFSEQEIKKLIHEAGFSILEQYKREPKEKELQFTKMFIISKK